MDTEILKLLPELNRRKVSRQTTDAFLRFEKRAWESLLEAAGDEELSELQRANAVSLLLQLQLIGDPAEVRTRDRGELLARLEGLAVCPRRRLRAAGIQALIVMLRQSMTPPWPALPTGTPDLVRKAADKALELGVDAGTAAFVKGWLDGNRQ